MQQEIKYKTREEWLTRAKELLQEYVFRVWDIPENVKISCGWGGPGCSKKTKGICYNPKCSSNKNIEIFISPELDDESRVLDVLAHELIHSILGVNKKHGPQFVKIAKEIGLNAPWTATTCGPELKKSLETYIIPELGKYPHYKMEIIKETKEKEPKEQQAKMFVCNGENGSHPVWKCLVKTKFLDIANPVCPICGKPMIWDESADKKKQKTINKE